MQLRGCMGGRFSTPMERNLRMLWMRSSRPGVRLAASATAVQMMVRAKDLKAAPATKAVGAAIERARVAKFGSVKGGAKATEAPTEANLVAEAVGATMKMARAAKLGAKVAEVVLLAGLCVLMLRGSAWAGEY